MSTESFQLMRWVKLARKKGIPYFEPPVSLDPVPLESIKCPKHPMLKLTPIDATREVEKKKFGSYWNDCFHWDLVSKRVIEVKMQIEDRCASSRKIFHIWQDSLKSDVGNLLRVEWDTIIAGNLEISRKKDKIYDLEMTMLVYYNEEIPPKEKIRRWTMLDPEVVGRMLPILDLQRKVPWPQAWHDGENHYTQEEWDSVVENFPKALTAIQRAPEICLERRRLAAPTFWLQKKEPF
jgi:hypothetical protein